MLLEKKAIEAHARKTHEPTGRSATKATNRGLRAMTKETSLLDAILVKKTVDGEAGGITQHISAYQAERKANDHSTRHPGHEAFAALRQHGAVLTDVVIIVVAADDGVKPQTIEAIRFARTANAKIVVAINKMDKEAANPEMVKAQLASEHGLNPEERAVTRSWSR